MIGNVRKVEVLGDGDSLLGDLDGLDVRSAVKAVTFSGIAFPLIGFVLLRPGLFVLNTALRQRLFIVCIAVYRSRRSLLRVAQARRIDRPVMRRCRLVPVL